MVALSAVFALMQASPAVGQTCVVATTDTVPCTAPSTVTINTANATALIGSGAAAQINANGATISLGAAGTTGLLAQSDSDITFNGGTLKTSATSTGLSASQTGFRATDIGSTITAANAAITLGPANGTTSASNMTGMIAASGGALSLTNTSVVMLGGGNGASNTGLLATGNGSQISFMGGSVSTMSRGSYGVWADSGGVITLGAGAQIATTGVQITAGAIGSHALLATGGGSTITGDGIIISTSGQQANAARAESGGTVSLTNSTITSASTASADADPSSAVRALSGGQITISGSTIATTGLRANGFSVQDAGSLATISNTSISTTNTRAYGAFIFNGGAAIVTGSTIQVTSADPALGYPAVSVQDAGSTITLTDTVIGSAAAVGYGLKVTAGGAATMTGGSATTSGRDGPAFYAANGTITGANVVIATSGIDNAMGVLADLNGRITLTGGSVTTTGNAQRLSSYPHGLAARNPGGTLIATGTTVLTTGLTAMGVVADDGGSVTLAGNSITTLGAASLGLYATVEQAGPTFPATIRGDGITVETSGFAAHGATANQHFLVAPSVVALDGSSVTTHGNAADGLRAIGAGTVNANLGTVFTEGAAANGMHARDNGSSVNVTDTDVLVTGADAQGALANSGGLITGNNAVVRATGANGAALYVAGAPGNVSNANFTASNLTNTSGPTIGVGGNGNVALTGSSVSGSGQWLHVATITEFPPLAAPDAGPGGITDPEGLETPPVFAPPAALPVVPGLATIQVDSSTVEGSALTAPGSVSNLTLANNSRWTMTGSSNITNLVNDPSLIQFTPPSGDTRILANYKTLTVVNYAGEGGAIGLNTYLADDPSPSDRLVVDGGAATGVSLLKIANTTGPGALTTGNGIEVVSAVNGATTVPHAFVLGNIVAAGPYEYLLFRGGLDPGTENNWYLRNVAEAPPNPPEPPCPPLTAGLLGGCPSPPAPPEPAPPEPEPGPTPLYRMEAPLYSKISLLSRQMGLMLLDSFHARQGDQYLLQDEGAWGRTFGGILNQHFTGPLDPAFNGTVVGLQLGSDVYVTDDREDRLGLFLGYAHASGTVSGTILDEDDVIGGDVPTDAFSLGGYYIHIAPSGWYLDGVLMGSWFESDPLSVRGIGTHVSGTGLTASLEGGKPFKLDEEWTLEPMAQVIFTGLGFDNAADPFSTLEFEPADAWYGRLGARLEYLTTFEDRPARPYVELNLWHGFGGTDVTVYNSVIPVPVPFGNTDIQVVAGATSQTWDDTALSIRLSYTGNITGNYQQVLALQVGVRTNW